MPLAFDTAESYEIALESDLAKPAKDRPVFYCKAVSDRKWKEISRLADAFDQAEGGAAMIDNALAVITEFLSGWKNMSEYKFDPAKLEEFLTPAETIELMQKCMATQTLSLEDKKKSEWLLDYPMAESAKTAKGSKNARTRRQSKRR